MIKEVAFNIIVFIWERLKMEKSSKLKQFFENYPKEYENLGNKIKRHDYINQIHFVLTIKNCLEEYAFGVYYKTEMSGPYNLVNLKFAVFNFIQRNWKRIQKEESRLKKSCKMFLVLENTISL